MLKSLLFACAVVLFALTASSASGPTPQEAAPQQATPQQATPQQPTPQQAAPAPAPGRTNPVKPTPESQARAKVIYAMDCAMCHGDNGNGKTDVAQAMQLTLGDWTDAKTLAGKPDGELFNQIRNGKGKMPGEDVGRAKDHEVWNLVLYIRGMAKK
jgi:mono/diheme cytochrome c family protein